MGTYEELTVPTREQVSVSVEKQFLSLHWDGENNNWEIGRKNVLGLLISRGLSYKRIETLRWIQILIAQDM